MKKLLMLSIIALTVTSLTACACRGNNSSTSEMPSSDISQNTSGNLSSEDEASESNSVTSEELTSIVTSSVTSEISSEETSSIISSIVSSIVSSEEVTSEVISSIVSSVVTSEISSEVSSEELSEIITSITTSIESSLESSYPSTSEESSSEESSSEELSSEEISSEESSSEEDYGEYTTSIPSDIEYSNETKAPYDIYPIPHDVYYKNERYYIPNSVNVVFEDTVDVYTKDHLYDVLAMKDIYATETDTITTSRNILVGVYDENELVESTIDVEFDDLFTKIDSYYLSIDENNITILGKDTDACFYGITTLQWIFDQCDNVISTLEIKDYSDTKYRGFIEGYYGIPWTNSERVELMEYASLVKSNIYIYAPKDDSYHSSNWRGLYNDSDLLDLKEQIETGRRTKTRFAWSIHPFLTNPIRKTNYEEGLAAIKNKFEQLYENGVRQFVISADDVYVDDNNRVEADLQRDLLNDMTAWCKEKGDCYNLVFVPSAYCYMSDDYLRVTRAEYFSELCDGLDESVDIMWTGEKISSSVKNGKFEEFIELSGREAFMWLNWPVNDYCVEYLLMGKGEVLNKRLARDEEANFSGIVTNPMQQAEQSKLSIFAICDYCWNINDFDCDESYDASMVTVEETATKEFKEVISHMVNATPYEDKYFDESEEFKVYTEGFEEAYLSGDLSSIDPLIDLYEELIKDAEYYLEYGSNLELKKSIRPWVESLILLCKSSVKYLEVLKDPTSEEAVEIYREGLAFENEMKNCVAPVLNKINYNTDYVTVKFGVSCLKPFQELVNYLAKETAYLISGDYLGVTYRGFDGIYEGEIDNINDNDKDTYVWFNDYPGENAEIRIDLGELTTINDIYVLQGNPNSTDALIGDVEVSTDGKTYQKVGELTGVEQIIDLTNEPIEARYIKLVNNGTSTWVSIREVQVNTIKTKVTHDIFLEEYRGNKYNIVDGDLDTYVWLSRDIGTLSSITVEFEEVIEIRDVTILQGLDDNLDSLIGKVEVSEDGLLWTKIGDITIDNQLEAIFDLHDSPVNAKFIRLTHDGSRSNWVIIREIMVNTSINRVLTYENIGTLFEYGELENAFDGDYDTYAWFDYNNQEGGAVFTLDLNEVKDVYNIDLIMGMDRTHGDYLHHYELLVSEDGETWINLGEYHDMRELYYESEEPLTIRYVKVHATALDTSCNIVIREIAAY